MKDGTDDATSELFVVGDVDNSENVPCVLLLLALSLLLLLFVGASQLLFC